MNPNLKNRYNLESAINEIWCGDETEETIKEIKKAVNWVTHNSPYPPKNTRNNDEYPETIAFEQQLAMLIHDGFIHNSSQLMEYLRKCWMDKYCPDIFFEIE
jgi:hypothetical protein